jgi:hypothetical protein
VHHTTNKHPLLTLKLLCLVSAVFLFVGSAAYTLTNMREDVIDVLYNDNDSITDALAALGFAGFGLGEFLHIRLRFIGDAYYATSCYASLLTTTAVPQSGCMLLKSEQPCSSCFYSQL